jgi:hypothetical protein
MTRGGFALDAARLFGVDFEDPASSRFLFPASVFGGAFLVLVDCVRATCFAIESPEENDRFTTYVKQ